MPHGSAVARGSWRLQRCHTMRGSSHRLNEMTDPLTALVQVVGDHIRDFDVEVASPELVADEVRCAHPLQGKAASLKPISRLMLVRRCAVLSSNCTMQVRRRVLRQHGVAGCSW